MPTKLEVMTKPLGLAKSPTGIRGLDEVTGGGLPSGRPTLITGPAGSGKTLLAFEFLAHGAIEFGEPGVFLTFEESAADLEANVASLGFDLPGLRSEGKIIVDAFNLDPNSIVETGAYDLEGLFIRLDYAIREIGAKRVAIDTIEVLFGALGNASIVRSELTRLFRWLKERGLTAVLTGEKGQGELTRRGIEEYVSDCVIVLDHRIESQIGTRRLRIAKYRGTLHGTDEYPFVVTDRGIAVLPISSMGLAHGAPKERMSSGIERLDFMLGGGIYRGSSVLISGEPGTGKTTICARVVEAACERGDRALMISFEESPAQLIRNMASVGIDLETWTDRGLLRIWSSRPSENGLEAHLVNLSRLVEEFDPSVVAIDAMTSLSRIGDEAQIASAMIREIDLLKSRGITALLTSLTHHEQESSEAAVSSLMDTWLLLRNLEANGERNRLLFVKKSRGSAHSNQVREFVLSGAGIDLVDVWIGDGGIVTGTARVAHQAAARDAERTRAREVEHRRNAFADRTAELQAQIDVLSHRLIEETDEWERFELASSATADERRTDTVALAAARHADPSPAIGGDRP